VKQFLFAGAAEVAGRRQLIYTFKVLVSDSHYRVKAPNAGDWLTVGYEGVLYVDAETADPVRVTVATRDVPPAANVCRTTSTLKFHRDASVAEDALLPVTTAQRFINPDGTEVQNTITFSNCRQYSSESTITFYTPAPESTPARRVVAAPQSPDIPEWLPFTMEMITPIDTDTAAAGDRFRARLGSSLRDGRFTIAPKGTLIEGRVSHLEVGYRPKEVVVIGLKPESMEIRGVKVPFSARLDLSRSVVAEQQKKRKGLMFLLPARGELPQELRLPGTHNVLKKGFTSHWLTAR
jgi:hypothetical protein